MVPSPSPSKRRLSDTTSPRPPTPPRESPRTKTTGPFSTTSTNILPDTAPTSSPPLTSSPPAADKSHTVPPKKRVLWSPWTKYHKPDATPTSTPIRTLIAPRTPLKSILKPSPAQPPDSSPLGRPIAPHTFTSFAAMLESVLTALASSERSRKLDTYITFSNTLKAYDDVPDISALIAGLSTLCGFVKRDLSATLEDGGNPDTQLIQQAVKLLVILAWTPGIVEEISDADAAFFLDHAIARIEDAGTPKIVVNHNLHFLAQQKFSVGVMTSERAGRIVTALESLEERVTGKSITKERIDVYYKLLYQAKMVMAARIADWMDNLFGGLLSSVTEVRNRALICIAEVSRVLGRDKNVPRTLTNIFSRTIKGKRMFDSIKERLDQFIKDGEGVFVARMWGIVLLCVKTLGDHWEYFTPWLRIIEGCFNVSDKDVKVEAQVAWSKLIYSMSIGPHTTRKLLGLLCKPLEQYLDPKNAYSNTKKPRKAAMANVSVLLYYGFRPTATQKQISDVWDLVVVSLVEKMALSSKEEVAEGCGILISIFDGTRPRKWTETRVLASPLMAPEDVPRLDPKWVRSNTALILNTLEVALRRGHWRDDTNSVKTLWAHFTKTLSDAGSKEIKVSAELMEAVSHLLTFLRRIWTSGPAALLGAKETGSIVAPSFIRKYSYLVTTALQSLGTIPFTDKTVADEMTAFVPAATPTMKYASGGSTAVLDPPVRHLFRMFLDPLAEVTADEEYYECVRGILLKCVTPQDSRRKKLALLASCVALLPHKDAKDHHLGMWQLLGQLARKWLARDKAAAVVQMGVTPANEFRDVVKVLEWGCPYELQGWKLLFTELCTVVGAEQGEAAVASVVIEPLVEALRNLPVEAQKLQAIPKTVLLTEHLLFPTTPKSKTPFTTAAVRRTNTATTNTDPLPTTTPLAALLSHLLTRLYTLMPLTAAAPPSLTLLTALSSLLSRTPPPSLLPLLKGTQTALALYIQDENQTFTSADITRIWDQILSSCERLPAHDNITLLLLAPMVEAGLRSKRKSIVSSTVSFWNETFGTQMAIVYPSGVRSALKMLRPIADLRLPDFEESVEDESASSPPVFTETQNVESPPLPWSVSPLRKSASPFAAAASPVVKATPLSRRSTPKKAPPPKPKHMDSQIEFAPIHSDDAVGADVDSQTLTEHQKEVKERQRAEGATLFDSLVAPCERRKGNDKGKKEVVVLDEESQMKVKETQAPVIPTEETGESIVFPEEIPETLEEPGLEPELPVNEPEPELPELLEEEDNLSDYGSSISELPSLEDYVDAPSSPVRRQMVTVEVSAPIPPPSNTDNTDNSQSQSQLQSQSQSQADTDNSTSSFNPNGQTDTPDAQIRSEHHLSAPTPMPVPTTPKNRRKGKGKKKKSPETLGTIVISDAPSSSPVVGEGYWTRSSRAAGASASVEGTPSRTGKGKGTPKSGKEKLAVTPTTRFSPVRTRASARKGTAAILATTTTTTTTTLTNPASTPTAAAVETAPASRKRKLPTTPTHTSPTPRRLQKRPRSTRSTPSDPDISFVGETQLSYGSTQVDTDVGVEDVETYGSEVDELVMATPYAGVGEETHAKRRRAAAAAAAAAEKEPEVEKVQEVKVEKEKRIQAQETAETPSKKRRTVRSARLHAPVDAVPTVEVAATVSETPDTIETTATGPSDTAIPSTRTPTQASIAQVDSLGNESDPLPPSSQQQQLVSTAVSTTPSNSVAGREVIANLRSALSALDVAQLTSEEAREAEEVLLGAFMGIRNRGR